MVSSFTSINSCLETLSTVSLNRGAACNCSKLSRQFCWQTLINVDSFVYDHYDFENSMDSSCLVTVNSSLPEQRRLHAIASSCPDNFADRPWIKLYRRILFISDRFKNQWPAWWQLSAVSLNREAACNCKGAACPDNFAQEPVWSNQSGLVDGQFFTP